MPALPEPPPGDDTPPPGQGLAVAAESLYLINLLLLPGLGFLLLLWLFFRHRDSAPPLARVHLRQTVSASLWAGALLILANLAIVVLGGYQAAWTWIIVILYFTTVHATLVLLGILGLARALAGQPCRYPLVGTLLS
ncbi:MAG: hypothetical protein KDJ22_17480 [Candidatus Competibacteraceae bacterium]|nr:hypothetical protein [Candidatus Competibacteraceae bacterium]